jgi:cytochrome c oxidase subunit 2
LRHAYMETPVYVLSQADFDKWVSEQQAATSASPELRGQQLAQQYGCANCHSTDGSTIIGPTWLHLYGSMVNLSDGTSVTADDTYLSNSILDPNSQIVAGFPASVMPNFSNTFTQTDIDALVAYIKTLK